MEKLPGKKKKKTTYFLITHPSHLLEEPKIVFLKLLQISLHSLNWATSSENILILYEDKAPFYLSLLIHLSKKLKALSHSPFASNSYNSYLVYTILLGSTLSYLVVGSFS